ncbi:NUDIX domain-containing protein [Microaerobacter geothermalis]|nr:NUDIX domain-containing protein [Microaerobacter geothermalis]
MIFSNQSEMMIQSASEKDLLVLAQMNKRLIVVKTSTGYFLPGGGIEENETHEECLKREFLEELGYVIKIIEFIGRAKRYFYSTQLNENMVSEGFFYIAELIGEPQNPPEYDHQLVWLKRDEVNLLFHTHQVWAAEKVFNQNFNN